MHVVLSARAETAARIARKKKIPMPGSHLNHGFVILRAEKKKSEQPNLSSETNNFFLKQISLYFLLTPRKRGNYQKERLV